MNKNLLSQAVLALLGLGPAIPNKADRKRPAPSSHGGVRKAYGGRLMTATPTANAINPRPPKGWRKAAARRAYLKLESRRRRNRRRARA